MTLCLMVARQIRQKVAFNGKLEDFMKYANGASKLFYRTEVCIICASIHSFSLIAASFVDPYLLQLIIIIIIIINEFHRDASLKLMTDGPSFSYEKLVRETWYKKFVYKLHPSFSYEKHGR